MAKSIEAKMLSRCIACYNFAEREGRKVCIVNRGLPGELTNAAKKFEDDKIQCPYYLENVNKKCFENIMNGL